MKTTICKAILSFLIGFFIAIMATRCMAQTYKLQSWVDYPSGQICYPPTVKVEPTLALKTINKTEL